MLKKLTKVLSLLLILCMMVSMFPVVALADEGAVEPAVTETPEETTPVDTPVPVESPVPSETPAVEESPAPSETPADSTPVEDVPAADGSADFVLSNDTDADEAIAPASTGTISYPVASNSVSLSGNFRKIVMVDAGRKYFTADWIIALINEMKADGYTTLCLAVGNDGLRFLLDDMSVLDYTSDNVKAAIRAGNDAYDKRKSYAPEGTEEWTQAEMDRIFAAAGSAGIEIIPLINTPGHMDAILYAITSLTGSGAYNGSSTTIDVTNATAVNFTYALLEKYVAYFFGKGCTAFNIGCDEYANDVYTSGGMGFGNLQSTGNYASFVKYVNGAAALVQNYGLAPICFNDGIYYNGDKSTAIDSALTICYWSSGWRNYLVLSAADLSSDGFKLINTHGDFYYVLGKDDKFDSGYSYASNWNNTTFPGSSGVSNKTGSMFCIWCDSPAAETETETAQKVRLPLRAMAAAMSGTYTGTVSEDVVPGGFNANGSLNVVVETVTKTDETTGISVTAPGLTGLNVVLLGTPSYTGATLTVGYDIKPKDENGEYSGNAVVTVPVPDGMPDTSLISVWDVAENKTVPSTVADGHITFTVTHFSEYDIVYNAEEPEGTEQINLVYGEGSVQKEIKGEYLAENVDKALLNESVATVDVTGVEGNAASTTYTQASVTCNTLISTNSNSWTDVSGYYYKAGDGNYYPVYAKRSRSWSWSSLSYTYTYTWGYSTTSSTDNVTQVGTQETESTNTTPNITVYTPETVEAVEASTTITFTPVGAGTTYVTVGSYTYKIVVARAEETVNVVINETAEIQLSGSYEVSGYESYASYTVSDDGKMTITGIAEGEFTVTDANTVYTVKVSEVDLSTVEDLTIEYWITNGRPTDSDSNTSYSVTAETVYSESGVDISAFLPATTRKDGRTLEYWCGRLLDKTKSNSSTNGTEEQTITNGDDETLSGSVFTKVRYWGGKWQVFTSEWVEVTSDYQLVAYYMEVVDIKNADGESELHVNAADWGTKGDGTGNWGYTPEGSRCSVSVQIVYEDGTTNPSDTTANNLKSKTFVYGYWSSGRGLGTMIFNGQQNYQIYKVTAETGDMTSTTSGNYVTVTGFTWDENEETVWEGDATQSVSIGNPARSPSYEEPLDNLTWNTASYNRNNAILIRVYVRTVATESALTVHYIDQTANAEFYNYNIAVKDGTTFNEGFALGSEKNSLVYNTVENYNGVTQTVTADLGKMSEIGAQYRYSDYTCVKVERSEDGKEVYLYYTFNNAHSFVVDFGLPLKITTTDLGISGNWTSASVSGAQYGTAVATIGKGVTYTPTQTLKGVETLQLTLTDSTGSVTHQIYIYPATTVYYEEGFATGSWTGGRTGSGAQTAQKAGESSDAYGYDAKYARESTGASNGSEAVSSAIGDDAVFTFTGTGVDIYANCTTTTGGVSILIRDSSGAIVKLLQVNTATGAAGSATAGQAVDSYSLPIASVTGLAHGTYTVTIRHSKVSAEGTVNAVRLDGFRVYGTLATEPAFYTTDKEDNPTFIELRDQVLYGLSVTSDGSGQVNAALPTDTTVAVVASSDKYTQDNVNDLLTNGPKNEIFLQPNQALVLKITTAREVQIGLKALNTATTYTINNESKSISTSTDMFYTVLNQNSSGEQTITITNTGSGILSITKLKICDDPGAALGELTEEDLIPALVSLGYELEPEEPEVQYADATLTVEVNGQTATLTKNGVVGESATFTAVEIEAAAQNLVPDGYELKDQAADVTVAYGDSSTVSLSAEAIPTEPEQPEEPEKPAEPQQPEQPDKPANIISAVIRLIDRIFGSLKGFFR